MDPPRKKNLHENGDEEKKGEEKKKEDMLKKEVEVEEEQEAEEKEEVISSEEFFSSEEEEDEDEDEEEEEEEEEAAGYALKIAFIGRSECGKTALISHMINETFDETVMPTIGAAFRQTNHPDKNGRDVCLDIWDTAGQEQYRAITPMYTRGASILCICYDVMVPESLQKAQDLWKITPGELLRETDSPIIVLVACKMDGSYLRTNTEGDVIDVEENDVTILSRETLKAGEIFARHHGLLHWTTSAKTGRGVKEFVTFLLEKYVNYTHNRKPPWEELEELLVYDILPL